jgi:hypothetical protein
LRPIRALRCLIAKAPKLNPLTASHCVSDAVEHRVDNPLHVPMIEMRIFRLNQARKIGFDHQLPVESTEQIKADPSLPRQVSHGVSDRYR